MADQFNQRKITLPIAGEGEQRKTTTDVVYPLRNILAVTTPQGTGGKGAYVYLWGHFKSVRTAQTFSFKNWQEMIESKDPKTGLPRYNHQFVSLGSKMMVNLERLDDQFLDVDANALVFKGLEEDKKLVLPLDNKEQFTYLTERLAEKSNKKYRLNSDGFLKDFFRHKELKNDIELILGALVFIALLILINTGLLIAVLCIVA